MSDKIGVLGSSTSTVLGTATAYTCPAGKAAKIRLFFQIQGNAGANTVVSVLINGQIVMSTAALGASFYLFTIGGAGMVAAAQAALPSGATAALTVAPADMTYELSTGQTVQYTLAGGAATSANFMVIGAEIDV